MRATELLAVHLLVDTDILQLGNDPRFYRVMSSERSCVLPDSPFRVRLRSTDGAALATLVRAGREQVLIVPRKPGLQAS